MQDKSTINEKIAYEIGDDKFVNNCFKIKEQTGSVFIPHGVYNVFT